MSTHASEEPLPSTIGRYHINGRIATGGFGVVYRGQDAELGRDVAIKVLHRHLLDSPRSVEFFLVEARILASLDHPGIVPIHDIGRTPEGQHYLVAKFVEGTDLRERLRQGRMAVTEAVGIVAQVAEALHHAHEHGLVHRDIKPANILVDASGRAYVVDFGLALRREEFGTGPEFIGTLVYMSPEQASHEGHRVDVRSDIYSLGVVFFELLTGQRPFQHKHRDELIEQIRTKDPPPPRAFDETIPPELERICLKALANRALDRQATAQLLAEDLRHWQASLNKARRQHRDTVDQGDPRTVAASQGPGVTASPVIVPRGLRAYEGEDAVFFLDLLPGPRDRDGLPESIAFWKARLEAPMPEETFRVGVLYGPSGCGKSSLVKAGLLPRLDQRVSPIYVEVVPEQTEPRLMLGLRRAFPGLAPDQGLVDMVRSLRQGRGLPAGHKAVLVLDQFEQWLHAEAEQRRELIQALRQCDGVNVQALLLVRDDFWLALSRFMRDLEIPLVEGRNTALVDLFDPLHARKVLAEFGRAFGRLPASPACLTAEQEKFLDQTVAELAEGGKVVPVRLSLFADMIKGKPWTPAMLRDLGGIEGIGVVFLDETFTSANAPAPHRRHEPAARAVLKLLLPEPGSQLKGRMHAQPDLLEASSYAAKQEAFDELLRLLDVELRLVTSVDPEISTVVIRASAVTTQHSPSAPSPLATHQKDASTVLLAPTGSRPAVYYQLTHDYLVPALRQWLTRKQRETRRGRAELCLAERAALWKLRPEDRALPALGEWLNIQLFTRAPQWNEAERRLMRSATRYFARRGFIALALLSVLTLTVLLVLQHFRDERAATRAAGLVAALVKADPSQVPELLSLVERERRWTAPPLAEVLRSADASEAERLRARVALLGVDPSQIEPLGRVLLTAPPAELLIIRNALEPHKDCLVEELWRSTAQASKYPPAERFRAACALAAFDPKSPRWETIQSQIVAELLTQNTYFLQDWLDALRPVRRQLLGGLARAFHDREPPGAQMLIADILVEYAADQPVVLAQVLPDAAQRPFQRLWEPFARFGPQAVALMEQELDREPVSDAEFLARRRAQAAVTLLRLGAAGRVWPLLRHTADPRLRSYLIHAMAPFQVESELLWQRFDAEPDLSARRALLLALGEYPRDTFGPLQRQARANRLLDVYRTHPDAGVHAAAGWLLRRWGMAEALGHIDRELAGKRPVQPGSARSPGWFVNTQGQTLVIQPGPVDFDMGSPEEERGRAGIEGRHRQRVPRSFAIAATEVTVEQFLRFRANFPYMKQFMHDTQAAVVSVSWYEAAAYCRWLSEQEGLPEEEMCYPPIARIHEGMVLPADYRQRAGYRLPTEAEWEYACRAGSVTTYSFGTTDKLLGHYGWYIANSDGALHPVGLLKPNDFGLFDLHGNANEWCDSWFWLYPRQTDQRDQERWPV